MKKTIIFKNSMNDLLRFLLVTLIIQLAPSIGGGWGRLFAQNATCNTPGIIAKWDFNTETVQCNGQIDRPLTGYTNPSLSQGMVTHCPQVNAGCGKALLGSKGHQNTPQYQNALCLFNFYDSTNPLLVGLGAPFDPNSTVWNPLAPVNVYVDYVIPTGKLGCFTNFQVKVLQKQFNGTQAGVNFEKQGVAVYRNGVQVYSQTQPIMAANVNATPMTFNFTGSDFCSDGSQEITFRVYFGLVHQLSDPSLPWNAKQTGYDDICLNGTCGGPNGFGSVSWATCTAGVANADGSITLADYAATDKADYTLGTTYTGGKTYATATAIPSGGVITTNLPNPSTASDIYTVRLFDATGCFSDIRIVLKQTVCPPFCNQPTGSVTASTPPTCSSTTPQNNGSIAVSGVTGGDKVGITIGGIYTGPAYAGAGIQTLAGGAYTFTGLANPVGGSQLYTIRVYNAADFCYIDKVVELLGDDCAVCKKGKSEVWSSSLGDPDSTPANDVAGEDDQAIAEFCLGTKKVDLALTKSVSTATGTVCGTSGGGTTFTWTVSINNTGDLAATDIQIADVLPTGLQLVSSSATVGNFYGNVGWLIPTLAAGGSATLTITTKVLKAGTFKNVVEVIDYFPQSDPDSTPNNFVTTEDDYAEASITVTGPNPPQIVKEFSPMLTKPNTPTRLTIKITNNESTPLALSADFVDTFPTTPAAMVIAATPNLAFSGLTPAGTGIVATVGAGTLTIPKGTVLQPGLNQVSVEITVPSNGNYCNDIAVGALKTASCDNIQAAQACILANDAFTMAPLIKKAFAPQVIQTGTNSTLTLTIENRNSVNMTLNQDFVDYLPAGLLASGAVTGTCLGTSVQNANKEIKMAAGTVIAPGTCTVIVPVTSSTAGDYCNTIVMNALITTVGTNNNLGNEDIAQACVKVTANPCTTVGTVSFTQNPVNPVSGGAAVTLTATASGISNNSVLQWSSAAGVFSNTGINPTVWTAPATNGTYTVSITVNNNGSGYGTCTATASTSIVVGSTCTVPAFTATTVQGTCTGATTNADAKLMISGVTNGDKVAYSTGATYSGAATYSTATLISALSPAGTVVATLANPASTQQYSIRVYNTANTCYTDQTVTLNNKTCTVVCVPRCGTITITVNP